MPVLMNTKKGTSAQICTAFESYLAIFGQIARKSGANAGRWTPDTYGRPASSICTAGCWQTLMDVIISRCTYYFRFFKTKNNSFTVPRLR
jgi:hypothetical protein